MAFLWQRAPGGGLFVMVTAVVPSIAIVDNSTRALVVAEQRVVRGIWVADIGVTRGIAGSYILNTMIF